MDGNYVFAWSSPPLHCWPLIEGENNALSRPLLLSRFSRVRLCAAAETAAHQAPLSLGFSRQEHWSGLPFPSPINAWKWKVKVKSLSRVRPSVTPWTATHQAPPSMGFSRQEYWSGVPLPSPLSSLDRQYFFYFRRIFLISITQYF